MDCGDCGDGKCGDVGVGIKGRTGLLWNWIVDCCSDCNFELAI